MGAYKIKLLVIDPEGTFVVPKASTREEFNSVPSAEEGIAALNDVDQEFDAVFLSQDLSETEWTQCVGAAVQTRPDLPIFNVLDQNSCWRLSEAELDLLKHNKTYLIYKSKLRDMIEAIEALSVGFDPGKAFHLARVDEEAGVALKAEDDEFFEIKLSHFMSGKKSIFDVYVKLVHNVKYVKIFSAKDVYDPARLNHYHSKGLESVYIRTEAVKDFVRYANHITKNAVKSDLIDAETKYSIVLSLGCQTLRYFRNEPTEETVELAKQYASYVKTYIEQLKKLRPEKFPVGFFAHLTQFDHSASSVLIAGLIAMEMAVQSSKSLEGVSLAALLHDVSLTEEQGKLTLEDYPNFSPEQKQMFVNHPHRSAFFIKKFKNIDEGVVQAILQHHVRMRGTSFPERSSSQPINWIASVVGLSDEIVHAIEKLSLDLKSRHLQSLIFIGNFLSPSFQKSSLRILGAY